MRYTVTSRLDKLALWYDYTIVCSDIKRTVISRDGDLCRYGFELTDPIEYTREELLNKYDGKIKISRWAHTYTEDGKEAMAVVINEKSK